MRAIRCLRSMSFCIVSVRTVLCGEFVWPGAEYASGRAGFMQATGWPCVVAVMANWYGKGKRGAVMGEPTPTTLVLSSQCPSR